jgi:hypothetical protein
MMKCEDVLDAVRRAGPGAEAERRAATEHLAGCESCRNAAHALAVLRADRDLLIEPPSEGAFARAVEAAASARELFSRRRRAPFWLGVGSGLALAAGIAGAVLILRPLVEPRAQGIPAVTLAVNEARDVSVALSSPEALAGAEIRVALSGEIGLRGFADQRELHWRTDLDRGVNRLTLPLVALGPHGGQVLVEVQYGEKRRAFVVDVHATERRPTASLERLGKGSARRACAACAEPETV